MFVEARHQPELHLIVRNINFGMMVMDMMVRVRVIIVMMLMMTMKMLMLVEMMGMMLITASPAVPPPSCPLRGIAGCYRGSAAKAI